MQNTLLLVDGSSYLYRAFHAMPDLRSPSGEPTGALYGIINMLGKLREQFPASYIACVFDAKGKTFRDDWYPEYKANRAPMPDALQVQIPAIHKAVTMLGWPILMVEGIEADDVIGTLATQASAAGLKTIISTGDKDLMQLVNDQVTLVNTMSNETLDIAGVINKIGLHPEQIVDYLSLMGDTVDNVPGIEKVGPKTAVKWLTQYKNLDGVVENADKITGVVGENLRKALDWLPMAKRLLTVKIDCNLSQEVPNFDALKAKPKAGFELIEFFTQYGFKTWLQELRKQLAQENNSVATNPQQSSLFALDEAEKSQTHYETIFTLDQLNSWLEKINHSSLTAFDTETTSTNPLQAELVGISISTTVYEAAYIPLQHQYDGVEKQLDLKVVLDILRPWLESEQHFKVGQNLKYDGHILENYGIRLRGIVHDTLLASYVLEAHKKHDLESLANRHLQRTMINFEEICGKGAQQILFSEVPIDKATEYAAADADCTLAVHQTLWPQIETDQKLKFIYQQIELPVMQVLQTIERKGVLIDVALLEQQSHRLGQRMQVLEQEAYQLAGQTFNLNSPKQIGEIFFERLQLPVVKKTASGAPSTDEEVLEKLAEDYPLPKLLLEYRTCAKLKSTYTDKLPHMVNTKTGRVHTNYAQAVAVTGRLASNDPNLQNIPIRTEEGRQIRAAFIASPASVLIAADYSQIELRIMAHLSGDKNLLDAFSKGEDVHRRTASEIFSVEPLMVNDEQRRTAKVINFGLIYGMSAFGLAKNLGIERSAAQYYIERYFERYPGVAQYMEKSRQQARQQGYVETIFGRRLWLPEINSPNGPRRQAAERAAINAPMQGSAADLIKLSMIAVQKWLIEKNMQSAMILQVHDELVLEVPLVEKSAILEQLPKLMSNVAQLHMPLTVEMGVGNNWHEAH